MKDSTASWSHEKTGVILLSGFLGAGKTTLLKQMLAWESDLSNTVVIVNEFGEVGIDGAMLKGSGADVVELTSGCICCTLSIDLKLSLEIIREKYHPERIFIESSGVADPTSIASVLAEPGLRESMELRKIITVLDADFWEAREAFGTLFFNQLEMAHLILLNKIDLMDKDQIPAFLREIHETVPNSQVIPTIHCRVDSETLWAEHKPTFTGIKPMAYYEKEHASDAVDATGYVTFSFQTDKPLDETRFSQFGEALPFEVFRMKGPVRFADRAVMVNFVGGRREWSAWDEGAKTRLAFVGWNVSGEDILKKLADCVIR